MNGVLKNIRIIEQNKKQYKIVFPPESKILVESIMFLNVNGMTTDKTFHSISFYANTIKMLPDFLKTANKYFLYNIAIQMVYTMNIQLSYLIDNGYSFTTFNLDDIIVLNDETFICINPLYISKLDNRKRIKIIYPFKKDAFISPELNAITYLPYLTSYKSIYYSLGLLTVYVLFNYKDNNNENVNCKINIKPQIKDKLKSIENTKLYWCLYRVLQLDQKNRIFVFL